ncbi:MAG: S-layer homology domain-containing protein, partial [Oscillospiraceae bacterium]
GIRNVFNSFDGTYDLTVTSGDKAVAVAPLDVCVYESYRRYNEVHTELLAIQKAAEKKGLYLDIVEYGTSEGGFPMYYVTLSDSKASVESFEKLNARATTEPEKVISEIKSGKLTDYRIPFMVNNQHADEYPNMDSELNLLWELVTKDTITYQTLTGLKNGKAMEKYWAPALNQFDITGFGNPRMDVTGEKDEKGNPVEYNNNGKQGASDLYTISGDIKYRVNNLLDQLILVMSISENPDGRTYGSRRNFNGFDHNRDTTFQTQAETRAIAKVISQWNPVVFLELHGYMTDFLVEPCSPPHEPNLEYDILVQHFFEGGEAFGKAALATIDDEGYDYKFSQYTLPLRDNFNTAAAPGKWDAWDDLSTNYTPSYAMLNCNAAGYTVETPKANEASVRLFECGMYGMLDYYRQNKEAVYLRQLEFFDRGLKNVDASKTIGDWYVDVDDKKIPTTDMRPLYKDNDNFFCEYWVIPVDPASQKDIASAYEMGQFLLRNDVKVSALKEDTVVNGVTYKAGSLIVDMHQAKRNYANCVLYNGVNASASGFVSLYSDAVTSYPEQWGFDVTPVAVKDAFKDKLTALTEVKPLSAFTGEKDKAVIISNESIHSANAINTLLAAGKAVGMITAGDNKGDFLVSYADYLTVAEQYTLAATGVSVVPQAQLLAEPTLYIVGQYSPFHDAKISSGYFAKWFAEGYGSVRYDTMHRNGSSMQDLFVYTKQMNFKTTDDPTKATVIIGSAPLSQNKNTEKAVLDAVKAGTPYIATGWGPMEYIMENLLTEKDFFTPQCPDGDMLHYITYPQKSLITANHAADKDDVIYAVDGVFMDGAILTDPNTTTLIQCKGGEVKDYMISGCAPDAAQMSGKVEAIAYDNGTLDLTLLGNSITNKAFQRDDYNYATNAIYTETFADKPMVLAGLDTVPTFTDVTAGHWAADSIYCAAEKKMLSGTSATTFAPSMEMDRAMLLTALYRMSGKAEGVTPGATWYTNAVAWAVEAGVSDGTSPEAAVSREQIAVFLYNYAKLQKIDVKLGDTKLESFSDSATVDSWAKDATTWAVAANLLSGKDGGKLDPLANASRAEVATILCRFAEL